MVKAGLVPVVRTVVRDGKSFLTTVYVKAKHESKVDQTKKIQVPDWKFSNESDFQNEVDRINNLRDRSERTVLKEHLLDHIEKKMNVKWDKVSDTDPKAFVKNTMRAFSAAKKELKTNPVSQTTLTPPAQAQPTPATPTAQPTKGAVVIVKQPGKDNIMDRETSKKMARDIRDAVGMDELVKQLKSAGITWDEVPDKGPNNMRALRAYAAFLRKGGELGRSQGAPQPQLVINQPNAPLQPTQPKSKYEKDSIQHDYENAPARYKFIGLVTGMMPLDENTAKFLEDGIKEKKIGFLDSGAVDFKLPKKLDEFLTRRTISGLSKKSDEYSTKRDINKWDFGRQYISDMFKGTPYEKEFEKFKANRIAFEDKYWNQKSTYNYSWGVEGVTKSLDFIGQLDKTEPNWANMTGQKFLDSVSERLRSTTLQNSSAVNELWDDLNLDEFFKDYNGGESTFGQQLHCGFASDQNGTVMERAILKSLGNTTSSWVTSATRSQFQTGVSNGTISKETVLKNLADEIDSLSKLSGSDKSISYNIADSWRLNGVNFLKRQMKEANRDKKKFKIADFQKLSNEILSDLADLSTPEADHIATNIVIRKDLEDFFDSNRAVKAPDKFEVLSKAELDDSRDMNSTIKAHVGSMRQKTAKTRAKYDAEFKANKQKVDYVEAFKNGTNADTLSFPDAGDILDTIKSTVMEASEQDRKTTEAKIHSTHDTKNHGRFTTKVHGVYRVKRIAGEEKFQKINDDINNTGFYYHGTSLDTMQKVCGLSGGFKVFTAKDRGMIKAGSMLGYGIYLASESSKSMQYVGHGFNSGNRGVLMVCKASLGKVVQTRLRGCQHNQPIMDRPDTDTVFMDRPDVINPEWAVKRGEQAVPRLLIDAERVHK